MVISATLAAYSSSCRTYVVFNSSKTTIIALLWHWVWLISRLVHKRIENATAPILCCFDLNLYDSALTEQTGYSGFDLSSYCCDIISSNPQTCLVWSVLYEASMTCNVCVQLSTAVDSVFLGICNNLSWAFTILIPKLIASMSFVWVTELVPIANLKNSVVEYVYGLTLLWVNFGELEMGSSKTTNQGTEFLELLHHIVYVMTLGCSQIEIVILQLCHILSICTSPN